MADIFGNRITNVRAGPTGDGQGIRADLNAEIMLGSNDSKSQNWLYQTNFDSDYQALISHYATLSSHPFVYVCTVCPVYGRPIP